MRFSVDELKAKADETYEPVEVDLPSGAVARFENLVRLNEEAQSKVMGLFDEQRKAVEAEGSEADDEVFDLTKFAKTVSEQKTFLRQWVNILLEGDVAAEFHAQFGGDIAIYLLVFNSWMSKEGDAGEASPSAD